MILPIKLLISSRANYQLFINMIKLSELIDTSNHPEDHNMSNAFNKGFPWSFEDPSGIYESEEVSKIQQSLIGREFQTLEDVKKICSRLRQAGYAQSDIEEFLRTYII